MPSAVNAVTSGIKPVRIVYQNDTHLSWENLTNSVTGFQQLSQDGYMKGRDVLRLHAGDFMTGSADKDFTLAVKLANMMRFHAVALGNHELYMGLANYVKGVKELANFPTLASNLDLKPGALADSFYQQLKMSGQFKQEPLIIPGQHGTYGVIGLTRSDNNYPYSPEMPHMGFQTASLEQSIEKVRSQVKSLQSKGVQKIILLSHLGYDYDKVLASKVDGLQVIIGGDSHTVLNGAVPGKNWVASPSGRPVLILQAGDNANYVGVADLNFDANGQITSVSNRLIPSGEFAKDPTATAMVESTLPPDKLVTTLTAPMERPDIKSGMKNNVFPEFVADQIRRLTGADLALLRRTEVRNTLPAGPLTYRQLERALPYDSELVVMQLSGQELLAAMSQYMKSAKKLGHGLMIPSGLRYALNPTTRELSQAQAFNASRSAWEPLQPSKLYRVAMTDFVLKNAFEAPLMNRPQAVLKQMPITLRDAFMSGIQQANAYQTQFTPPVGDGRIKVLG